MMLLKRLDYWLARHTPNLHVVRWRYGLVRDNAKDNG
jgi:hypothetical protein